MFDRSWSYLSGLAAIAVVPAAVMYADAHSGAITHRHFSAQPLHIGVKVATVTRPLDLKALSSADFGDGELR